MKHRLLAVFVVLVSLGVASPVFAGPISVSLVPSAPNVAPGSTVTVSVNMVVVDPAFRMTAISAVIFYDPTVFTFVGPVVQGAFLEDDWSGAFPMGAAATPGQLRVAAIDWSDFSGEEIAAGGGTLFTFTLLANSVAPAGSSALTWGNAACDSPGLCYGDADFRDVLVPSTGTTIDVQAPVPDQGATLTLLGCALVGLGVLRRRFRA